MPFAAPCLNVCFKKVTYETDQMILLKPSIDSIPAYVSALRRGWSPTNLRSEAAQEQLDSISKDAPSFILNLDDPTARGGPVTLPDGSKVPRLPSIRRWIWDDGFCGQIGLRWKPGTEELPPTCLGHIGYAVVPWRQGEGLASAALLGILPEAKAIGLKYVEITTSPDNPASMRVIEKAGGTLARTYIADKSLGGYETLEFKISLAE
ncbi:GNAT family N-acetyltransferase [Ascidiaceihabitans sp.]|uniref:GNAT family N-acetyltransferase n=2 Tax=Ascidiaceihabitans sp. TaxID=1872644 RepID=UPI003297E622